MTIVGNFYIKWHKGNPLLLCYIETTTRQTYDDMSYWNNKLVLFMWDYYVHSWMIMSDWELSQGSYWIAMTIIWCIRLHHSHWLTYIKQWHSSLGTPHYDMIQGLCDNGKFERGCVGLLINMVDQVWLWLTLVGYGFH